MKNRTLPLAADTSLVSWYAAVRCADGELVACSWQTSWTSNRTAHSLQKSTTEQQYSHTANTKQISLEPLR